MLGNKAIIVAILRFACLCHCWQMVVRVMLYLELYHAGERLIKLSRDYIIT